MTQNSDRKTKTVAMPTLQLPVTILLVIQFFSYTPHAVPVFTSPNPDGSSSQSFGETALAAGDTVYTIVVSGSTGLSFNPAQTKFTIVGNTIQVAAGQSFDYESGTTSYTLTIEATDGTNTQTADLTINIIDENDNLPVIDASTVSGNLNEEVASGTTIMTVSSTDADALDATGRTYSLIAGGSPNFQIGSTSGVVTNMQAIDYDTAVSTIFKPVVMVTDNGGNTGTATLTINLIAQNDNSPVFSLPATGGGTVVNVEETTAAGSIVYYVLATDDDRGDTITYNKQSGSAKFTLSGQQITVAAGQSFDYETASDRSHSVTIRATDSGGSTTDVSMTFSITDVNDETPTLTGTFTGTVAENQAAGAGITSLSLTAADGDVGDTTTFSFISGGPPEFQISTAGVVTTSMLLDYDTATVRVFNPVVQVVDGATPVHSVTQTLTISLTNVNDNTPVFSDPASSGGSVSIAETTAADTIIYNVLATDGDNDPLTYSLVTIGSKFTLTGQQLSVSTGQSFDYETTADRTHSLTISAVDDSGLSADVTLTVSITDINDETPTLTGDFDGEIAEESAIGTTVTTITVTGADTDDGDTLTYSFIYGGAEFSIDSSSGEVTTAQVLDYDTLSTTVYFPVVQVEDSASPKHSATQTLTISLTAINDNTPIFSSPNPDGSTIKEIGESVVSGTGLYTLEASDLDGDTVTYSFVSQNPSTTPVKFAVNSRTLATAADATFDYEITADRIYYVTVMATDGSNTQTAVLTVQITDEIDETPTVTGTTADLTGTIAEGQATGTVISFGYTVADADSGDTLTYSFVSGTSTNFQIDASTGSISTADILDYEAGTTTFNPVLKVADSASTPNTVTTTLTISVTDVNDNTPLFTPSVYTATIPENTGDSTSVATVVVADADGDTVTVSILSGDDATAKFKISGMEIQTDSNPTDFETTSSYTLIVIGTDGRGNTGTATVKVAISGVNEAGPAFGALSSPYSLAENTAIGHTIVTTAATDSDSADTPDGQITFSLGTIIASSGGSTTGLFHIDPVSGVLTTTSGNFDRDTSTGGTATYDIDITATDQGGSGTATTTTIQVALTDYNDNDPSFTQGVYTITIPESTAAATSLLTLTATDQDESTTCPGSCTFAIETGDTAKFELDGTTANQLNLKAQVSLDGGDSDSYTLTVIVKDGETPERTGTAQVSIAVTPVNDAAPVFGATTPTGTISIAENENIGYSVATVAATDTDYGADGTITYSIASGNSENKFQIDPSSGKIELAETLDYETTTSYTLGIKATDGGATAQTADTTVSVSVTDVSDVAPTCTDASVTTSVREDASTSDTVATLACTDADAGDTISYSITSGDTSPATFAISTAGVISLAQVPDYETTQSFNLVVQVTDGTNTLNVPVAVSVTAVNEGTPTFGADLVVTFAESTPISTSIATHAATDSDISPHDIIAYSISAVTNSGTNYFVIDPQSGYIELSKVMDYESLPTGDKKYIITVQATDGGGSVGSGSVTVSVTDVNDLAPVCTTFHVLSLAENTATNSDVIASFGCSDTDGSGTLSYSLSPASPFSVDTSGTPKLVLSSALDYETTVDYTLLLEVSDGGTPSLTTTVPIDITVTDVNEAGPAFAGDQAESIAENTGIGTSVADCVATGDPDGTSTSFGKLVYSFTGGNTNNKFHIDSSSGRVNVAGELDRETTASYSLVVQAIEEAAVNSASMTLVVTITDINDNAPTCNELTFNQILAESAAVDDVIHTMTCSDADGDTLSYTITGGSDTYFKTDSNVLKVKAAIDYDTVGVTEFQVTVTVSDGANSVNVVGGIVITDVNEHVPVFTSSGSYTATVPEDEAVGFLVATVVATDDDLSDTVTFSFSSTYSLFTIDSSSGQVLLAGSLDRETATSHTLSITGSDGTNSVTASLVVTVSDVNDNAPIFNPRAYSNTISEATASGATVATVIATDADDAATNSYGAIQYSIADGNTGNYFSIDTTSGEITTALQLDYETATSYTLKVQATDSAAAAGARSSTAVVTVLVGNSNEFDPSFSNTPYAVTFAENTAVGTSITQVTASDQDSGTDGEIYFSMPANPNFYLNPDTGIIYLKAALDYELSTTHTFDVTVHDQGATSRTATTGVTITVTDDNDNTPGCTPTHYSNTLAEDTTTTTTVATLVCSDADTGTNAAMDYTIKTVNSVAVTTPFSVSGTGVVTLASALDYEATSAYVVLIEVADQGTPSLSTTVTVNVVVTDVNENDPVFSGSPPYSINVNEATPVGSSVGNIAATDADTANTLEYYFNPTSAAFAISPATGDIYTTSSLDVEVTASYSITVYALDDGTSPNARSASTVLTVTITNTNDNIPVFSPAVYTVSVPENQAITSTIITVTATDADDATLTYSIYSGNTNTNFRIDKAAGEIGEIIIDSALDYETTKSYTLVVFAEDAGSLTGSTTVHVTVTGSNDFTPAYASASSSVDVAEGTAVGTTVADIDATDADDGDDGVITYTINSGASGKFAINPTTGVVTVADTLDRETTTSYTVIIRATDGGVPALYADYTLTVTVTDVNDVTPVCTSSLYSVSVAEDTGTSVSIAQLDCSDSDADPASTNNNVNSYTITSGNTGTAFAISNTGEVTVVASLDRETTESYTLAITVADAGTPSLATSVSLFISITDVNDHTPSFASDPYVFTPDENLAIGTSIGQVAASDGDAGLAAEIEYSIFSGNGDGKFSVDSVYGIVKLANTLDYDLVNAYVLVVYGKDKDATTPRTGSTTVSINVNDVNDHYPACTSGLYTGSVAEDATTSTSVVTISCSDIDTGSSITYSITTAGVTDFSIHNTNGIISTAAGLDIESTASYTFTVQASDGTLTTDVTVMITVTNVNDISPSFTPPTPYATTISEATAKGTTVYDVDATDGDIATTTFVYTITGGNTGTAFAIAADTGVIQVQAALDRETTATYTVNLEVADGTGVGSLTSSTSIVITISDENDNYPSCDNTVYTYSLSEDTTVVTDVANPVCSDNDDSQTMLYAITAGNGDGKFEINGVTGVVKTVSGVTFDYEITQSYTLTVTVDDQVSLTSTIEVRVFIDPVNDNPPVFTSAPYSASVAEDASLGTVVTTIAATDNDLSSPHNTIAFSIQSGDSQAQFSVNPSTGVITVAKTLDRETTASYTLTVRANDGTNTVDSTVTVTVTDVNDNYPVFNPASYTIEVNENVNIGAIVQAVTATDDDEGLAGTVQYAIAAGNTGGAFSMSGANVVTAIDIVHGTNYVLTITGTDQGTTPLSTTTLMSIQVNAVNEDTPVFANADGSITIDESTAIGTSLAQFVGSDSDTGEHAVLRYYIHSGNTNDAFILNQYTGQIDVFNRLDYETTTSYNLAIRVEDTALPNADTLTSTRSFTVIITDVNDETPIFGQNTYTQTLDENTGVSHSVLTVAATDNDSGAFGTITYSITSGNGASYFTVGTSDGIIRTSVNIDYETNTVFDLNIKATDGGSPALSATCLVKITIIDKNDNAPVFQVADFTTSLTENLGAGTTVTQVVATDADSSANSNNVFSYTIDPSTNPGVFSIDTSGYITLLGPTDRESTTSFTLKIEAADSGTDPSTLTSTATVTVIIVDENDNDPSFSATYTTSIAEDTVEHTNVHDIDATDIDEHENAQLTYAITSGNTNNDFRIDSLTGIIQVANTLDRETTDQYLLTVTVTDGGTPARTITTTATVDITDVNDNDPAFTQTTYTFSVAENVATSSAVGTIAATDNDINTNAALTYTVATYTTGEASHFTLDPASGAITTASTLDRETRDTYEFVCRATDGGTPSRTATATVTVSITDYNDRTPTFSSSTHVVTHVEEQAIGTSVLTVTVTDGDLGVNADVALSIDTSQLDGTTANTHFSIDSANSQLSVISPIDRETYTSLSFYIVATDGGFPALSSSTQIDITIEDINDNNPVFTPIFYNAEIAYNDHCQVTVAVLTATDADTGVNAAITYAFTQNNHAEYFSLNPASGLVSMVANAVTDTGYLMYASASDGGTPTLTSTTGATIRVDTYHPNERVISFYMDISKTTFLSLEATFLTQCNTAYQATYSTSQCKRWCVVEITSTSCVLHMYVIKDDTADDISEIGNTKVLLTMDEAYNRAASDDVGTPSGLFTGPSWTTFAIVRVQKYYVADATNTPWIETQAGIITVSVVCAVAGVLLILGIAYGVYRCRKPTPNQANRVEIGESSRNDKVAKNRYNNNVNRAPSRLFKKDDKSIQQLKDHPAPAVVALPMPGSKAAQTSKQKQPRQLETQNKAEASDKASRWPRSTNKEDFKGKSQLKPKEDIMFDPQNIVVPSGYRASVTEGETEEKNKDEKMKTDKLSQVAPTATVMATPEPPPRRRNVPEPTKKPLTPSSVEPRVQDSPKPTPKNVPNLLNREFDGTAIDPVTGRMYQYNTKTHERRWVVTPDGKDVKLATEDF